MSTERNNTMSFTFGSEDAARRAAGVVAGMGYREQVVEKDVRGRWSLCVEVPGVQGSWILTVTKKKEIYDRIQAGI
ncbi:MAG: hypothetical protein II841_04750 [Bacteroidales bacterium]|nr:hypothetical protein [Bacteroidales bacterium]